MKAGLSMILKFGQFLFNRRVARKSTITSWFLAAGLLIEFSVAFSQSMPVGTAGFEDAYRRWQLTGAGDSVGYSFMVRPVTGSGLASPEDSVSQYTAGSFSRSVLWGKGTFRVLPLHLRAQYISHHPYGWNDGPMIPARGFQTMTSPGAFFEYGPLTVQFQPELVMAGNPSFEGFPKEHYPVIWARYFDRYNNIDLPERFGEQSYQKLFWGQTSVRLNYRSMSLGASTENLWWGPGIRNSLLMSNNAPGFKYFTLNTRKPVRTRVGAVEGQLVMGRLEDSDQPLLQGSDWEYFGDPLEFPKPNRWRYFSGLIFTWQPKWVPGLYLGYSRTSQIYGNDGRDPLDYLPFFPSFRKGNADDPIATPQRHTAAYFRWLLPEEKSEVYFEFGRNQQRQSFRQFLLEPEKNRAYTFGVRKAFELKGGKQEHLLVGLELSDLQLNDIDAVRSGKSWYMSEYVRQGYTNRGQLLGAGIGPGGVLQSLQFSWFKGLKQIGFQAERYVHDNDFFYYAYEDSKDFRRHWIDLSLAVKGTWDFNRIVLNMQVQGVRSINYQWYLKQNEGDDYMIRGRDEDNFIFQVGALYRF